MTSPDSGFLAIHNLKASRSSSDQTVAAYFSKMGVSNDGVHEGIIRFKRIVKSLYR